MSDKLSVQINGKTVKVVMSFGMLNEVAKIVGSVDNIGSLIVDAEMREAVLVTLLSERDEDGEISKPFNAKTADLTIEDYIKIANWVSEHLLSFFLKLLEGANLLQEKVKPQVSNLTYSSDGSAS